MALSNLNIEKHIEKGAKSEERVSIGLQLPKSIHTKFEAVAEKQGTTVNGLIRAFIKGVVE